MAKVNWINGKIAPPESGEYYVILEATEAWDSVKAEKKKAEQEAVQGVSFFDSEDFQ